MRLPGDMGAAGLLLLVAAGLAASSWGILTRRRGPAWPRPPDRRRAERHQAGRAQAWCCPHWRRRWPGLVRAWKGATRTTETLTRIALLPLLIGLLFAGGAVAVVVVGRWRRARARAHLDERVPADRCHCWERD